MFCAKITRSSCLVFSVLMFWYIPQNIKWKSTCQYNHIWNDLSRCRATYLLTPVLTGAPSFSDLHHNRTSSWSRTMAAHIFHQLPITLSCQINGQCETVRHSLIILSISPNASPTHWIKQEFRHYISLDWQIW